MGARTTPAAGKRGMSNRISSLRIAAGQRGSLHPRIPLEIIRGSPREPPEHTTRLCAEALAARLTAFWHGRGFPGARFWPVEYRAMVDKFDKRWDIRSNLVNGIPPTGNSV